MPPFSSALHGFDLLISKGNSSKEPRHRSLQDGKWGKPSLKGGHKARHHAVCVEQKYSLGWLRHLKSPISGLSWNTVGLIVVSEQPGEVGRAGCRLLPEMGSLPFINTPYHHLFQYNLIKTYVRVHMCAQCRNTYAIPYVWGSKDNLG